MRYWKCACCSTVLVTNPQDSAVTYSCPQCLKSACLCGGYSEIDIEEFKSIAFAYEKHIEGAKVLSVGYPSNEKAAQSEKYAKLTIDGYEARFAMTGITTIANALHAGLDTNQLSAYAVKEAITAFELLHKRMWELCDAEDAAKKQSNN